MFDYGSEDFNNRQLENVPTTAPIIVYDAIMGTGKSKGTIDKFNRLAEAGVQHDEPHLVILPYLSEITRYQRKCRGMNFQEPLKDSEKSENREMREKRENRKIEPCTRETNGATNKKEDLKILLADGYNILTTHAMFDLWDEEIALAVRDGGYHVIIDEEVGAMKNLSLLLNPGERRELLELDYLSIDKDTRKVSWDFEKSDDSDGNYTGNQKYKPIRNHCKSSNPRFALRPSKYEVLANAFRKLLGPLKTGGAT